jgi:hypothetical protein
MTMACVAMRSVLVHPVHDTRASDTRVRGMLVMTSDGRRIRGGKRRCQQQSGRRKGERRNTKSAKSHGEISFRLATQPRRENAAFGLR